MDTIPETIISKRVAVKVGGHWSAGPREDLLEFRSPEATIYGTVKKTLQSHSGRVFYLIELDDQIEIPRSNVYIRHLVLIPPRTNPPVDDYVLQEVKRKGFSSILVYRAEERGVTEREEFDPDTPESLMENIGFGTISVVD